MIAFTYNTGYRESLHSYVNNINTIEGGTHEAGFRSALTRVLDVYKRQVPGMDNMMNKRTIEEQKKLEELEEEEQRKDERRGDYYGKDTLSLIHI